MRLHPINFSTRGFLALLVLLFQPGFSPAASVARAPALGRFPAIQAMNLNRAKLRLPQDFSGQFDFVLVSFAREQQQEVDSWIPAARLAQSTHKNFGYYELSAMPPENILSRWWFDAALRSDTADSDLRPRILTAFLNRHKFRASLRIANEKQVVALLVDRAGKVYWRADGPSTAENRLALFSALAAAGA